MKPNRRRWATQMLAAAESCNQSWAGGTKGGSGVPRSQGGIVGQKPELWHDYTCQRGDATATGGVTRALERKGVKYTATVFPPASQSPSSNYHRPKLIRNQLTWNISKCSPDKSALLPHSTETRPQLRCKASLHHYSIVIIVLLTQQPQSLSSSFSILKLVMLLKYKYCMCKANV